MNQNGVKSFLDEVRRFMSREEYLFPYVWAQRQFRDDNYQMGSASLLEDLFFDTLGAFIMQTAPATNWERRTGKEPWDYCFNGLELSHKEAMSPLFTAVWQPGDGPSHNQPRYGTWDFPHPITFVYSPKRTKFELNLELPERPAQLVSSEQLNHWSVYAKPAATDLFVYGRRKGESLHIESSWTRAAWEESSIHDVRSKIDITHYLETDMFIIRATDSTFSTVLQHAVDIDAVTASCTTTDQESGIYVFAGAELERVPLESNNKAHFPSKQTVIAMMKSARADGRFVPMPLWPALFADVTPANLYRLQRAQYDNMYAARIRNQ